MPNMDDIAFFDSEKYMHRGGIWGDACRKAQLESEANGSAEAEKPATGTAPEMVVKSQSTGDAIDLVNGSASREGAIQTVLNSAPELPNSPTQKSPSSDVLMTGSTVEEPTSPDKLSPEDDRGRSPTIETGGRRATSVPASKTASVETPGAFEATISQQDARKEAADSTSSSETDTPTSTHSRIRSLSSGANVLNPAHAGSRESLASRTSNATNSSSFLSALRSKDKQALSNTAKEAMRKWSANWSGFKRDRMGDSNNNNNSNNNSDEVADGISQGSMSSLFGKGRNFSEIRAAVSARRDRDGSASDERSPEASSSPIDIPGRMEREEDSMEAGRSSSSYPGMASEPPSSSPPPQSTSPRGPSILRQESNRASPSLPKVTTETHSVPSLSTSTPKADEGEDEAPKVSAPPIKTQPSQGAVMTIPGIHASHRGEVMSYGYVPPSPSTSISSANKRSSTIQPTIQSMYRLFKSPNASSASTSSQQGHSSSGSNSPSLSRVTTAERSPSQPSSLTLEPDNVSTNGDATPQRPVSPQASTPVDKDASESAPQHQVKRKPPPLPPRSSPAPPALPPRSLLDGQSQEQTDASNFSDAASAPAAELSSASPPLVPSASESLKLIAEQDETKRKDLEATSSSPERRPRPGGNKRSSLGARRITGGVLMDEPQQATQSSGGSDRMAEGVANEADASRTQQVLEAETEQTQWIQSDQSSDGRLSASEATKPTPPPLPPRRNSTLASTS